MSWPASLNQWLRRAFFEKPGAGPLVKLELRQIIHGSQDAMVETYWYGPDTPRANIDDLALEIMSRAQQDCEEHQGRTAYTIHPYYGENMFPDSRCPPGSFVSSRPAGPDWEDSDPPTAKGSLSQQMRHNEALVRMLVANASQTQQHSEKLLTAAYQRIEKLEVAHFENFTLVENMMSDQQTREQRALQAKENTVRQREAWAQAKVLLPVVVNKLAGQTIMPVSTTAKKEVVQSLIESFTPDQIDKLKDILSPPQLVGFAELYDEGQKISAERKAAEEKARSDAH